MIYIVRLVSVYLQAMDLISKYRYLIAFLSFIVSADIWLVAYTRKLHVNVILYYSQSCGASVYMEKQLVIYHIRLLAFLVLLHYRTNNATSSCAMAFAHA